jgi:eukaryotic-like serine/threonine-protein kinase
VSVFDLGEEDGQPFIVTELMGGGDVEGLIEHAEGHRVPLDVAIRVADEVCQGLEYAHGKNVVHRDLKPGNVWLTVDGTAKLGDFGLAVSLDRTRLTQAGMMVGTVSYMPPEQATGGEVTPRSDLYSLGAMLYELVTGRPPFVGDESVAIITQHLNTPPVSPSWHVPGLPAGLETLMLRLLEKDPAKRPGSAAEVRQILASVRTAVTSAGTSANSSVSVTGDARPTADDPMYRQAFVGREAELKQLRAAFDAAASGQGSLAAVVGEPGIGKTALCEQLATYVAIRGGKTLVGHCYEEGSLSLPYLPFVEALRSYVLDRDPEGLQRDLGSGAAEVARIVSEVRDRVPVEVKSASADPDEDRWRLYQALSAFLRNASSVQPLLVILEDLHWADRGTLDLLVFLARQFAGARLLIVGNYRDVEVDRAHPLSGALADLRRGSAFLRVPLRGLTVDEVHRMLAAIAAQAVSWSLAEAVHRQTEGNPLFVQEVLRYLAEEGLVRRDEGHWQRTAALEDHIPEGLRDVIGKRLSRLSAGANQVLTVASVVGREFRLDVLQRVAGLGDEEVLAALEEASGRAVVEQRPAAGTVGFRFTHAFFRQTLYEEIFVPRRIRLHQQVGRALEEVYGRRLDEHASELAEHFSQSTEPGDLVKALRYSERAADRAMQVFAYAEAVRHLEQALRTQEVLDPDDTAKRCDLLIRQAEAMLPLEDPARIAATVAEEAFALAEARSDSARAARTAVTACEAIWRASFGYGSDPTAAAFQKWAMRADHHAQPGTTDRVYADVYLGSPNLGGLGLVAAGEHLRRAVDLASQLGDRQTLFVATSWALARLGGLRDRALVARLARELAAGPREGIRVSTLGIGLRWAAMALLESGDRAAAEALWTELRDLSGRAHDATLLVQAEFGPVLGAYFDGRLEECVAMAEATIDRAHELGVGEGGFSSILVQAQLALGMGSEQTLEWLKAPSRPIQAQRTMVLDYLGRHDEAHAIRERFGDIGSDEDESAVHVLYCLFASAIVRNDQPTVQALARRLEPNGDEFTVRGWIGSIGCCLGDASAVLGDPRGALSHYERTLEVCTRVRFRPEAATIHLHQAEVLLQHFPEEQAKAQEHLDFAIEEFRAMNMQPSLERALRHKGLLHA